MNDDFNALSIETTKEGGEILTAALGAIGADLTEIRERRRDVEDFLTSNSKYWDFVDDSVLRGLDDDVHVIVYIPDSDAGRELTLRIHEKLEWLREQDFGVDMGSLDVNSEFVPGEDWAGSYKKYFKPLDIGDKLTICPEWEKGSYVPSQGRVTLYIDPGMVFGSGSHETTSLCLEFLGERIEGGERVFDAGCGSGILAIGALLFGAGCAVGADIDDAARHVVRHNAELNSIAEDKLKVEIGDVLTDEDMQARVGGDYDVICSNIIANVVIALAGKMDRLLKRGGCWIASGIIKDRREDVERAMTEAGLAVVEVKTKGEWVAILAVSG